MLIKLGVSVLFFISALLATFNLKIQGMPHITPQSKFNKIGVYNLPEFVYIVTQFSSSFAKLGSPVAQATKSTLLPSIQLEKKIEVFFSNSAI